MTMHLDLRDLQGNVVKAYGRYGFPKARYVFFRVLDGSKGRKAVSALNPVITTAVPWGNREDIPETTLNIAWSPSPRPITVMPSHR